VAPLAPAAKPLGALASALPLAPAAKPLGALASAPSREDALVRRALRAVSFECRARAGRTGASLRLGLAVDEEPAGAVASLLVAGAATSVPVADAVRCGGFTVRRGALIAARSPAPQRTLPAMLKPKRVARSRAWGIERISS
jgi:hypothetical protein